MINNADFDAGSIYITRASGRGSGPGNRDFIGTCENGTEPIDENKVEISRALPPLTCPSNGCCPHQNHYAQGRIHKS